MGVVEVSVDLDQALGRGIESITLTSPTGTDLDLYTEFGARMAARGCRRVRALAAPEREGSRRFHEALGFRGRLAPGYLGPGQDRIVYERSLPIDRAVT